MVSEASSEHKSEAKNVPSSFLCPITQEIMIDPVLDLQGISYERSAIEKWLEVSNEKVSPISRQHLSTRLLIPNRALQEVIHETMGKTWLESRKKQPNNPRNAPSMRTVARTVMVPMETHHLSPTNIPTSSSSNSCWYQEMVNSYLDLYGESMYPPRPLSLNEMGICQFELSSLAIHVEVPENVGFVFWYSSILLLEQVSDRTKDFLLKLNFFQTITRGGYLSLQQVGTKTHVIFSYRDRVTEITKQEFGNIIENFISIALHLRLVVAGLGT